VLFNSLEFLIFFPIVTAGYFLPPFHWRWLWLLVASCIFYMAFVPIYILILVMTIDAGIVSAANFRATKWPRRCSRARGGATGRWPRTSR
jgi:hypothetical protein